MEAEHASLREKYLRQGRGGGGGAKRAGGCRSSAVEPSWMHDSDMALDSDSTEGWRNSPQLRSGAAAAARPAGLPSQSRFLRRVDVIDDGVHGGGDGPGLDASSHATGGGSGAAGDGACSARTTISLGEFEEQWLSSPHFAFGLHVVQAEADAAGRCRSYKRPPYLGARLVGITVCWRAPEVTRQHRPPSGRTRRAAPGDHPEIIPAAPATLARSTTSLLPCHPATLPPCHPQSTGLLPPAGQRPRPRAQGLRSRCFR